jgi:hypothetical protein
MRLLNVRRADRPGHARVLGTIERGAAGDPAEIYYEYGLGDGESIEPTADPFAAAMLLPAMFAGEPLEIVPPVSPQTRVNLARLRDMFHAWWPEFARVEIRCGGVSPLAPARPRSATFFSGGVDSFYSLLKHRSGDGTLPAPLTHIVFMRGVETRLERIQGFDASEAWVGAVARATGVVRITGETNIRTVFQVGGGKFHWENHYYGSALASVGLALYPAVSCVCIPSGYSYNHLVAHGSTALGDEMFSTESVRLVHDGGEVARPVKLAKALEWDRDLVLDHLRVCITNRGGAYNCGKCYKCVRTAVPLRVLGLWDAARTFPDKSMDHWEDVIAHDHLALTEENLQFARDRGADARLLSMLERVVRRVRRRRTAVEFVRNSPFHRFLPMAQRLNRALAGHS